MSKIVAAVIVAAFFVIGIAAIVNDNTRFIDDCVASGKYERFECEVLNRQRFPVTNQTTVYNR